MVSPNLVIPEKKIRAVEFEELHPGKAAADEFHPVAPRLLQRRALEVRRLEPGVRNPGIRQARPAEGHATEVNPVEDNPDSRRARETDILRDHRSVFGFIFKRS